MIEIGPHAVTCDSIESPAVDAMMSRCKKARILYSDPPWGDGNVKYWATLNRKHTGKEYSPLSYKQMQDRLVDLIRKYVDGFVFIETGLKWADEVASSLSQVVTGIRTEVMKYRSGSKILDCVVIYGVTSPKHVIPPSFTMREGIGIDVVKYAVSSVGSENEIAFDPCCGMGYTAKAALSCGMIFRGNEFNGKRLSKTIDFLKKETD